MNLLESVLHTYLYIQVFVRLCLAVLVKTQGGSLGGFHT